MYNRFLFVSAVLWLMPLMAAGGQPGGAGKPSDAAAAEPAAEAATSPAATVPEKVKTQKVSFLGTATTQATPQQRRQAALPDGVGLTVQHVLAGSPAETAGLQCYDVLHKLNDQILVNDPQFRVLLRTMHPGDKIDLTFMRRGKAHAVTVPLGEKEVPVADVPPGELLRWLLRSSPAVEPGASPAVFAGKYEDDEHVLVYSADEQGKHLLAKNKQGAVLFDGLINTDEERKAIPEVLLAKLKRLETPPRTQDQPNN